MTTKLTPSHPRRTVRTSTRPRHHRFAVASLALVLALTACAGPAEDSDATGSTSTPKPPAEPTGEPAGEPTGEPTSDLTDAASTPAVPAAPATSEVPSGPVLNVRIEDDEVGPNAEEIDLDRGESLVITFDTDRAGELHVHSKPEQYVEFDAGTSGKTIVIETPGEVEVEDHDTGAVVALLEVS